MDYFIAMWISDAYVTVHYMGNKKVPYFSILIYLFSLYWYLYVMAESQPHYANIIQPYLNKFLSFRS